MSNYKIKKDRYRQERGNTSQMLEISCSSCEEELFIYQKDGVGSLMRCYVDRIVWSPKILDSKNITDSKEMAPLKCPSCENKIATPMIYSPENRPAYRMIHGSFIKKKYQSIKLDKKE